MPREDCVAFTCDRCGQIQYFVLDDETKEKQAQWNGIGHRYGVPMPEGGLEIGASLYFCPGCATDYQQFMNDVR